MTQHNCENKNLIVIDDEGREIFISQGIGDSEYGSFRRKLSGSLQRVKTKCLPMRKSKEHAEQDLRIYAGIKEWEVKNNEKT